MEQKISAYKKKAMKMQMKSNSSLNQSGIQKIVESDFESMEPEGRQKIVKKNLCVNSKVKHSIIWELA